MITSNKVSEDRKSFRESICGYYWKEYEKLKPGNDAASSFTHIQTEHTVRYIESQCSSQYGFLTRVSTHENLENSVVAIPNIFDSAVIMDALSAAGVSISLSTKKTVCKLLLDNRSAVGLWNFFPRNYNILPDDIDDSSCAVLALMACGLGNEPANKMAEVICDHCVWLEDGLVDVYYPRSLVPSADNNNEAHCLLEKFPESRRVDLGVTSNFLYLQAKVGRDDLPKFLPCYNMLGDALAIIESSCHDSVLTLQYAKHYTNVDVICYLISRLLAVSGHARQHFRTKLFNIFKSRLLLKCKDPISLACRLLGGVNAGLLDNANTRRIMEEKTKQLFRLRDDTTSTFEKSAYYNAHQVYYFGSTSLSSALAVAAVTRVLDKTPHLFRKGRILH